MKAFLYIVGGILLFMIAGIFNQETRMGDNLASVTNIAAGLFFIVGIKFLFTKKKKK